jgi:hypothetical protein
MNRLPKPEKSWWLRGSAGQSDAKEGGLEDVKSVSTLPLGTPKPWPNRPMVDADRSVSLCGLRASPTAASTKTSAGPGPKRRKGREAHVTKNAQRASLEFQSGHRLPAVLKKKTQRLMHRAEICAAGSNRLRSPLACYPERESAFFGK